MFHEICFKLKLGRLHHQRATHLASGYQSFQDQGVRLITQYWKGKYAIGSGSSALKVQNRSYNPRPLTFTMVASQSSCSHPGRKLDGHWLRCFEQSVNSHLVIGGFDFDLMLFEQYRKIDLGSKDREFVTNLRVSVFLINRSHQGTEHLTQLRGPYPKAMKGCSLLYPPRNLSGTNSRASGPQNFGEVCKCR